MNSVFLLLLSFAGPQLLPVTSFQTKTKGFASIDVRLSLKRLALDNEQLEEDSVFQERRRDVLSFGALGIMSALTTFPSEATAGIDPSLLKSLPVQGDESGAAQRLRQVESIQNPSSDLVDEPFKELPSGVSYREYRQGKGDDGTLNCCLYFCRAERSLHPVMHQISNLSCRHTCISD